MPVARAARCVFPFCACGQRTVSGASTLSMVAARRFFDRRRVGVLRDLLGFASRVRVLERVAELVARLVVVPYVRTTGCPSTRRRSMASIGSLVGHGGVGMPASMIFVSVRVVSMQRLSTAHGVWASRRVRLRAYMAAYGSARLDPGSSMDVARRLVVASAGWSSAVSGASLPSAGSMRPSIPGPFHSVGAGFLGARHSAGTWRWACWCERALGAVLA